MTWQSIWSLTRQAGSEFMADKATRLAAALAFYTALSLAPLLLVVTGIVALAFGEQAARGEIAHQLQGLIGANEAATVQTMLAKSASPGGGVLATVVGLVTLLAGATGVFTSLQDALDTVWHADPGRASGGLLGAVRDRFLSFVVVCGMAVLLLASLVLSAVLSGLGDVFERWTQLSSLGMAAANFGLSFVLSAALFALVFKVLPHARPAWSAVWPGALLTAVLFAVGKHLIGLYLGRASVGSTFGAAGSFVALLLWLYYSSAIVLFGAEFTRAYAARRGAAEARPGPTGPAWGPVPQPSA